MAALLATATNNNQFIDFFKELDNFDDRRQDEKVLYPIRKYILNKRVQSILFQHYISLNKDT